MEPPRSTSDGKKEARLMIEYILYTECPKNLATVVLIHYEMTYIFYLISSYIFQIHIVL